VRGTTLRPQALEEGLAPAAFRDWAMGLPERTLSAFLIGLADAGASQRHAFQQVAFWIAEVVEKRVQGCAERTDGSDGAGAGSGEGVALADVDIDRQVVQYFLACRRELESAKKIALAVDYSRVSRRPTLNGFVTHHQLGVWAPPQAIC